MTQPMILAGLIAVLGAEGQMLGFAEQLHGFCLELGGFVIELGAILAFRSSDVGATDPNTILAPEVPGQGEGAVRHAIRIEYDLNPAAGIP